MGGGVGFAGGELGGEQGAAFGAEHALCQELEDFAYQDVFADADGAGVVLPAIPHEHRTSLPADMGYRQGTSRNPERRFTVTRRRSS
jgi:hypothetical protein